MEWAFLILAVVLAIWGVICGDVAETPQEMRRAMLTHAAAVALGMLSFWLLTSIAEDYLERRAARSADPETAAWLEEAEQVSAMTIPDPVLDATATAVVP